MSDIIATIWDFDKTLINGYMQTPMFDEYKVESNDFWTENTRLIQQYRADGYEVNEDTFYLNLMLRYVRNGTFKGLNNAKLKSYGAKQEFYPGVVDLFREIQLLNNDERYRDYGIRFENYIVSTGLKRVIEGSEIAKYVQRIWGCEFLEANDGSCIEEVSYTIDNTTKTRAIFEINKGVGMIEGANIDVNSKIPESERRVQFCNMIYVADGPSDVPTFSLVNKGNGATFAVYPHGDAAALRQVEDMRRDGRVQMFAEANYTEGSTAYMWIKGQLERQAQAIIDSKLMEIKKYRPGTPGHLV